MVKKKKVKILQSQSCGLFEVAVAAWLNDPFLKVEDVQYSTGVGNWFEVIYTAFITYTEV
jgi:hypothetical protein